MLCTSGVGSHIVHLFVHMHLFNGVSIIRITILVMEVETVLETLETNSIFIQLIVMKASNRRRDLQIKSSIERFNIKRNKRVVM